MTNDEKARALLGSPAGCALVLDVSANPHLPLERFAEPKVSFWLASMAVAFADVHRDAGWPEIALRRGKVHEDLALQIISHPAFAWWYEPVDLEHQVWASPQMPLGSHRSSPLRLFDPERWGKPAPDPEAPIPTPWQNTSTSRGGSTSELTAFATGAGDYVCAFPLAVWKIRFGQNVRVREINHPADWHALCQEYPHRGPDGGLIPNWAEVANMWDGVHLTLGGMLSCEQAKYERDGEWSMVRFWQAEQTHWLHRLQITGERMPDVLRDHNRQNLTPYPYGPELRAGQGYFELRE